MAVTFATTNPAALLKAFDARIAQTDPKGKITTWEKLSDGVHYTHRSSEWHRKAFFKASTTPAALIFNIVRPKDEKVQVTVYGYYHGHLIETFLNHFDQAFSQGCASALPSTGDDVA